MTTSQRPRTTATSKPRALAFIISHIWAIATLAVIVLICAWIIQTFKKPGQMSVIETQSMDMSAMQPPKGAVPVGIVTAEYGEAEGSVTYTGTVEAFEDEDVYPRVTGRIVAMPVYPGDRVRRGQLLVQLDPADRSEYLARLEEAKYTSEAAMHEAGISKQEFRQKQHELNAAISAERQATKALEEAQASLDYWIPEIKRQTVLLKQQVVSQEEYDRELSQYRAADARVEQAKAGLNEAQNKREAAQAALDAQIHHIGHKYALSRAAAAKFSEAAIIEDYTSIRARDDGVVTKRVVSPGVVVKPEMLILKVAHISKVRVQAEVAGSDLDKMSVGLPVVIQPSAGSQEKIMARVTSVFPAADPSSRTAIVEAIIDNLETEALHATAPPDLSGATRGSPIFDPGKRYKLLPGQYVVMKITTGKRSSLIIPTSAVVWRGGQPHVWIAAGGTAAGTTTYTCVMHPEVRSDKPGKCPKCGMNLVPRESTGRLVAKLVDIEVGLANADKSEVLEGLKQGDQVIFAGHADLTPGVPVVATKWGPAGPVSLPTAQEAAADRLAETNGWQLEKMIDHTMVKATLQPKPPFSGNNTLVVKLAQHGGGAISGASVKARTEMPTMNMKGPDLTASEGPPGTYKMNADFTSGLWRVALSVTARGAAAQQVTIDVEVP